MSKKIVKTNQFCQYIVVLVLHCVAQADTSTSTTAASGRSPGSRRTATPGARSCTRYPALHHVKAFKKGKKYNNKNL